MLITVEYKLFLKYDLLRPQNGDINREATEGDLVENCPNTQHCLFCGFLFWLPSQAAACKQNNKIRKQTYRYGLLHGILILLVP